MRRIDYGPGYEPSELGERGRDPDGGIWETVRFWEVPAFDTTAAGARLELLRSEADPAVYVLRAFDRTGGCMGASLPGPEALALERATRFLGGARPAQA